MKEFWDKFFDWLERNVPIILLAFKIGRDTSSTEKKELENKLLDKEVELEKKKNKEIIEKLNKDLDDRSVIQRAIDKGRELLKRDG